MWLDLADTYRQTGQYDDALASYRKGIPRAEEIVGRGGGPPAADYELFAGVLRKKDFRKEAEEVAALAKMAKARKEHLMGSAYTVDAGEFRKRR